MQNGGIFSLGGRCSDIQTETFKFSDKSDSINFIRIKSLVCNVVIEVGELWSHFKAPPGG